MKLSFSTRGWEGAPWEEWIRMAGEMRFSGVEIYNAHMQKSLFDKSGPFHQYCISSTCLLYTSRRGGSALYVHSQMRPGLRH